MDVNELLIRLGVCWTKIRQPRNEIVLTYKEGEWNAKKFEL